MIAVDCGPALLPRCLRGVATGISEGWLPSPAIPVTSQVGICQGPLHDCTMDQMQVGYRLCSQQPGAPHQIAHASALLKNLVLHRQPCQSLPCSRAQAAINLAASPRQPFSPVLEMHRLHAFAFWLSRLGSHPRPATILVHHQHPHAL